MRYQPRSISASFAVKVLTVQLPHAQHNQLALDTVHGQVLPA
jgi:hypothetical protein